MSQAGENLFGTELWYFDKLKLEHVCDKQLYYFSFNNSGFSTDQTVHTSA